MNSESDEHLIYWSLVCKSSACPESITLPLQLHVPPLVPKRDDDGKIIIRPCSKEPTELRQEAERSTPQAARNILMWHLNFEIGYWFQEVQIYFH
ncbi:hypothetical protein QL285_040494 [Trifolium repens]|nr:hypothetical protein QL285_040494 [Trifolium repens]